MTTQEFYRILADVDTPRCLSNFLAIGDLRVSWQDGMAAKTLLWLQDNLPDDATLGDLHDVLDAAKWWSTLFASVKREDEGATNEQSS